MPTNLETAPVLLDTSAVIAHMVGNAKLSQRIKAAEFLPLIARGELSHGVYKSQRQGRTKEIEKVERILGIVEILYPGDQTADEYGRMIDSLEAQGQRIPTNDIWIAAMAAQYGLPLLTTDAHFKRIEDLDLILF
ncbi:MAG: PIN domain-containing protein [Verrucomicrobiota bacterium]